MIAGRALKDAIIMVGLNGTQQAEVARIIEECMNRLSQGQQQQTEGLVREGLQSLSRVQAEQLQETRIEMENAGR